MDREWLAEWRVSVTVKVEQLLETFQPRFGFEPGMNQLGPPAAEQALASLQAIVPRPAADLIDFYRWIGQVSLPDVGNGYFIHPADLVARQAAGGEPCRIGPPHELDVLVFGSNGGGALTIPYPATCRAGSFPSRVTTRPRIELYLQPRSGEPRQRC